MKALGLTGKISPDQVAKKWDNLKSKFKVTPRFHRSCFEMALTAVGVQDLKFPPRGMEGQTNPASWPWFQLMSDALEGRLAGKAPRVAPVWNSEEESVYVSSPPADASLMGERSSLSELDAMVEADDADGAVTYIDASGEECSVPSDPAYKSRRCACGWCWRSCSTRSPRAHVCPLSAPVSDQDTRRMIKLRAANEALFTGRRNAAKAAWK